MRPALRPRPPTAARTAAHEPERRRARILAAISSIPPGRVATYGSIARAAGFPGRARLVGRVLGELEPGSDVPWHRVVNASGRIRRPDAAGAALQRRRLAREGVRFTVHGAPCAPGATGGRVDGERLWSPGRGRRRRANGGPAP